MNQASQIVVLFISVICTMSYGQANKPPYVSAVPKYTFSNTLEEQNQELQSNPMVQHFANSRKEFTNDRYRPIYHYSSPEGRLGDPNGLCFWRENWHLFYQAWPTEDPRQHWGHAISTDLIHWKDLPYAIYPSPEIKVYSGSTLVEENRVIAMYHGTGEGNMIAVSNDPLLLNWEKIKGNIGNAVIPTRSTTGFPLPYSVFDPCIWKNNGIYYSLSGGKKAGPGTATVGAAYLFRSPDLKKWEYMHQFVEDDRFTLLGDDFACPYFWPVGDRYIMYFFSHMSGGQYLLGNYDTIANKFRVTSSSGHAGIGPPSATIDGKGGVVLIAKVGSYFTLPRLVTQIKGDELGQVPTGDISSLRYNPKSIEKTILPNNREVVLNDISGDVLEILAEIDMKNSQMIEMNVLRAPEKEEYTRIIVYKEKGYNYQGLKYVSTPESATMPDDLVPLFEGEEPNLQPFLRERVPGYSLLSIETDNSSLNSNEAVNEPLTLPFFLDPGETLKLRVFIDRSIIEVFVNDRQVLCVSVRPSLEESKGVSFRSRTDDAELIHFQAWQMRSIFE